MATMNDMPTLGGEAVTTYTEEDRVRLRVPRPSATPEDEDRFRALMDTDMRQQAEINIVAERVTALETNFGDHHRWLSDLGMRVLNLEHTPKQEGYTFKFNQELMWALLVGASGVLATALADLDTVTDWRAWTVGLVVGLVRFLVGFVQSQSKATSTTERV